MFVVVPAGVAAADGDEDGGHMGGGGSGGRGGQSGASSRGADDGQQGPNLGASGSMSGDGAGAGVAQGSGGSLGASQRQLGVAAHGTGGEHGTMQERGNLAEDAELHTHELVAAVLREFLSQPDVYNSFGLQHPPSTIPVHEAQEWLDSIRIVGIAQTTQERT